MGIDLGGTLEGLGRSSRVVCFRGGHENLDVVKRIITQWELKDMSRGLKLYTKIDSKS